MSNEITMKNPADIQYYTCPHSIATMYFFDPGHGRFAKEYPVANIKKIVLPESFDGEILATLELESNLIKICFSNFGACKCFFDRIITFLPKDVAIKREKEGHLEEISDLAGLLDFVHFKKFSETDFYMDLLNQWGALPLFFIIWQWQWWQ